jgi:hypothetical protein
VILPLAEVVPFLVDEDMVAGVAPPDKTDRNHTSILLHRVPDSEKGVCPESGNEVNDVNLSNEDDCVRIIANSENFTLNRMKHGDFAFMEQVTEDDVPALRNEEVMQYITLDWVKEGTLPEPKKKMKDTLGCLRKDRHNNFCSPVVSCMSTLLLIFWKVSFAESNRFDHDELRKAREKWLTENIICGTKWKQDITLGEFMVFFGILLQMLLFPLPVRSYVLYLAHRCHVSFHQQNATAVFSTNPKCTPIQ